jgi:O-antigen/teichoic acid export membrane protein
MSSGAALMSNSMLTSVLGVVFWVVAARMVPAERLGRDTAAVTLMLAIASAADLNMNVTLPRLLPQLGWRSRGFTYRAYAACCATALAAAGAVAVISSRAETSMAFIGTFPVGLMFAAACVGWGIFALQDSVMTALGAAKWVPAENALFGVMKIVLLVVLAAHDYEHPVLLAWVIGMAVLLPPVNLFIERLLRTTSQLAPKLTLRGREATRSALLRFLAWDYGGSLAQQAAVAALPLVVVGQVGQRANAYFSIALSCALALDGLFVAVCAPLTVEAATQPAAAAHLARRALIRFGAILVPALLLIAALAPLLLKPFGEEYVQHATTSLRLMTLAAIPQALVHLWGVLLRHEGATIRIAVLQACSAALLIGLLLVLVPKFWLTGAGMAWLVTHLTIAAVLLPSLFRRLRVESHA